jgi:serine-type D-Ala-D-Ala carboxypeptidase/endopeptidase
MRPALGLSLAVGLCIVARLSANAGLLPERVEKAARERIVAGTYQTLVFGVVDGDRSEIVVFGDLANGKAPDGDTVYEIGSVTKTFTATLLARAVLSGRVTLDTPVARLLPDYTIPSRPGREITLGDLATHHAGLPPKPLNMVPRDQVNPFADYDTAKLKAFLARYQLPRDPGAAFEYSDVGFGLLGHALAHLEHTTYGVLTDERLLKPLGMTQSPRSADHRATCVPNLREHPGPVLLQDRRRATRLRTRRGRTGRGGDSAPGRKRPPGDPYDP